MYPVTMMLETGSNIALSMRIKSRGFTLIEILVVLIIISVMVGMATIGLKRDYNDLLADDANRLKALIMMGRDEALFQARSLGIHFSKDSYGFVMVGEVRGSWVAMQDKQFRQRKLTPGAQLTLLRNEALVELTNEGKKSKADESEDEDEEGKKKKVKKDNKKPQILILSTGEVTPFTIELVYPARARLEMSIDALGESKIISNEAF